jgi:preprotein translocase subunit SecF
MRIFSEAQYQFIDKRKAAYVFSSLLILVSISAMVFNVYTLGKWQNYGVDFEGGSLIQVRFEIPMTAAELRSALGGGGTTLGITRFGEENEFVIRAPISEDMTIDAVAGGLEMELAAAFGEGSFERVRAELVGAKVGNELERKAAFAILFSFFLTLGILAVFRVEIALPTVAALLTIVGYSLNDTIVVFDRIRENLGKKGGRKEDPGALVNRSINETLPRTVLTSGTTLAVLVALLILGGAVVRDFTFVLILGVIIGTYSSIFVASPALLEIQKRWGTGDSKEKEKERRRRKRAEAPA